MTINNNSIKLRAAETCHSDKAPMERCNYCKKQGVPILIARYAVRGTESPYFKPAMNASSQVADAMPWDLRPNRTISVQSDNKNAQSPEMMELPSFAEYILRRPRQGYLYIYDEVYGGQWQSYYIDPRGYIKSEILSAPTSLSSGEEFSCNSAPENVALGSIITLPYPKIKRTVYLAFVESAWSSKWRSKISKDEQWRKNHMQSFEMSSNCSGPDIYPIENLEKLVFEYSSDILMSRLDNKNMLLNVIFNTIKGNHSIAEYTKKTIINHAKSKNYPMPFILALHDDIGITLQLNELRVSQQLMLQDEMQDPTFKRRHLCVTSLMSMEASIRSSPYATVKYDGVPVSKSLGRKAWELISSEDLTTKNPIQNDFHVEGIAEGKTYEQCQQKEMLERELDNKLLEEHPFQFGFKHIQGPYIAIPQKTDTELLKNIWDAQADAQEKIAKEFYLSKYFDYNQYYNCKSELLNKNKRIKKISERLDYDYCWWVNNKLVDSFELYDSSDLYHRAVATSLLSRALTGGILAQASRDLWKKFHDAPEENSANIVINGILGWNDELAKKLQSDLSADKSGPVKGKNKPKTIFEEYYIKEIGKTIKKVNSLYKDRNKIVDKDFSSKAFNAFKTMHESAQNIADTLDSTHKSLIASEQYIAEDGLTEETRARAAARAIKLSQYEFHSSGLRVTQFKTLRIMHAHRMACMDIVAHIKSIEEINNKILSQSALLDELEASYTRISKQLFAINNIERHIIFFERPIVDFFDDITRAKAQKISEDIKTIKEGPITSNTTKNSSGEEVNGKNIKYNNPDAHLYSNNTVEQALIYSDSNAAILEESVEKISASQDISQGSSQSERLDERISRTKYNKVLREEFSKAMNKDSRDRWVGRLSRLAIYWGFIESFKKLCKNPTDLQAWWKMSSSVVFVTQSYFDTWEQAAKIRLASLNAAQKAEIEMHGIAPEYLVTGSKIANAEVQVAKLWSKRIGVLGSIIGIIDGLCDLVHAEEMNRHGELKTDTLITGAKGLLSIASGIIGIMLIETVFVGGILALFAFAIALWLLPSTETLFPLGIRSWLRRSLFKLSNDDSRYLPFNTWEEEQAAFNTVLKGIEIDTDIVDSYDYYRITITMTSPLEISTDIKYVLEIKEPNHFRPVFEYNVKKISTSNKQTKEEHEINIKNNEHNRISIRNNFYQHHNPLLEEDTHNAKIKVILDIKKIDEYKKDLLQLSIEKLDDEKIDSYTFKLE